MTGCSTWTHTAICEKQFAPNGTDNITAGGLQMCLYASAGMVRMHPCLFVCPLAHWWTKAPSLLCFPYQPHEPIWTLSAWGGKTQIFRGQDLISVIVAPGIHKREESFECGYVSHTYILPQSSVPSAFCWLRDESKINMQSLSDHKQPSLYASLAMTMTEVGSDVLWPQ